MYYITPNVSCSLSLEVVSFENVYKGKEDERTILVDLNNARGVNYITWNFNLTRN